MNDIDSTRRLLLALTRDVTGTLEMQEVLDRSLAALRKLVDFGGGAIQLLQDGALVAAATDPPMSPEARTVRIPVGVGVSGGIAATGESVYIPDIGVDPRVHPEGRAKGVSSGVRSYMGLPLIAHGEIIGVVQVDAPQPDAFSPHDRDTITAFVPAIAAAVQNATIHAHEIATIEERMETERMKHDFIAIVSHELRTPLTAIIGFAESLQRHGAEIDPAVAAHLADRIAAGGKRLGRHLDDLMRVAGLLDGDLAVDLSPVDVGPVLRAACAESCDRDHRMRLRIDPDLPPVTTDADRLRQVLGALISNACKFSPPGTDVAVIAGRNLAGGVTIAVSDQGRGIPPDHIERIFDRFFQVSPADRRETGGLGIGLYLARLLCDRMGATIEVQSTSGEGSAFRVSLPAPDARRGPQPPNTAGTADRTVSLRP